MHTYMNDWLKRPLFSADLVEFAWTGWFAGMKADYTADCVCESLVDDLKDIITTWS